MNIDDMPFEIQLANIIVRELDRKDIPPPIGITAMIVAIIAQCIKSNYSLMEYEELLALQKLEFIKLKKSYDSKNVSKVSDSEARD